MKLSKPMIAALKKVAEEGGDKGRVHRVHAVTPGTLRALERRGLVSCDLLYATDNVKLTDAGRDALASH